MAATKNYALNTVESFVPPSIVGTCPRGEPWAADLLSSALTKLLLHSSVSSLHSPIRALASVGPVCQAGLVIRLVGAKYEWF
jgi:hypothetical protein